MARVPEPWSKLPVAGPADAGSASPLPEGSLAESVGAMFGVAMVLAAVAALYAIGVASAPVSSDARTNLVIHALIQQGVVAAVDSTVGVLALAGAIGVTASVSAQRPRSVLAVARRLLPGWFVWRWVQPIAMLLVLPGAILGLAVGVLVDPVAYGEARAPAMGRSPARGFGWLVLAFAWAAAVVGATGLGTVVASGRPLVPAGVYVVSEFATLGSWLLWAHACRKGAAATAPTRPPTPGSTPAPP